MSYKHEYSTVNVYSGCVFEFLLTKAQGRKSFLEPFCMAIPAEEHGSSSEEPLDIPGRSTFLYKTISGNLEFELPGKRV